VRIAAYVVSEKSLFGTEESLLVLASQVGDSRGSLMEYLGGRTLLPASRELSFGILTNCVDAGDRSYLRSFAREKEIFRPVVGSGSSRFNPLNCRLLEQPPAA